MPGRYGHACGLRASAPHAKPFVPSLTCRKRKALIAGLFRCAVEEISPYRGGSQQGHKYCRYCCGHRELSHGPRTGAEASRATNTVATAADIVNCRMVVSLSLLGIHLGLHYFYIKIISYKK